ncbi:unnamed protein product, partial [Phaeothamnion confervicola]
PHHDSAPAAASRCHRLDSVRDTTTTTTTTTKSMIQRGACFRRRLQNCMDKLAEDIWRWQAAAGARKADGADAYVEYAEANAAPPAPATTAT